jgi:hypothetical protein
MRKNPTARLVAERENRTYPHLTWSAIMIEDALGSIGCLQSAVTAE